MKRIMTLLFALMILPPMVSAAVPEISGLTVEELLATRQEIDGRLKELGAYPYIKIDRNDSGEEVSNLQTRLKELGYYSGEITGRYDANTGNAFRAFEKASGLKQDGVVTADEQKTLYGAGAIQKPTPTPRPTKKPTPTPKPTKTPKPTATPLPAARALRLTKVSFRNDSDHISFSATVKNVGSAPIVEFGVRVRFFRPAPLGPLGADRAYEHGNTLKEYRNELTELNFPLSKALGKGRSATVSEKSPMYLTAYKVNMAISYYIRNTGECVYISEDSLEWRSSDGSAQTPKHANSYGPPPQGILLEARSVKTGYVGTMVFNGDQFGYFYQNPGVWISSVMEGSIAERAGLEEQDMIVAFDGIRCADDRFAEERAKAKMAQGASVDLLVERKGQLITLRISKDMD